MVGRNEQSLLTQHLNQGGKIIFRFKFLCCTRPDVERAAFEKARKLKKPAPGPPVDHGR
jgi:hypothetical protein